MAGINYGQAVAFINGALLTALRENSSLFSKVKIGLIGFDTDAEWLVKPTKLDGFRTPDVTLVSPFGGACIGPALECVCQQVVDEPSYGRHLLVLISDGFFLDDIFLALEAFSARNDALRLGFGVSESCANSLAIFERWDGGGRVPYRSVIQAASQDLEAALVSI
jgi:uncharacterized protein YegL